MKKYLIFIIVLVLGWGLVTGIVNSKWDGKSRVTVLIASKNLVLVSYDPETEVAAAIKIPETLVIDTAYGYGTYLARALLGLDRQEGFSGELVADSLSKTLGVVIDGRLVIADTEVSTEKSAVGKAMMLGMWKSVSGREVTNLSWWDMARLWRVITSLRENKWDEVDLVEAQVVEQSQLPDGAQVYLVEKAAVFKLAANIFASEALAEEGINVLVLNTTTVNGVGSTLAQVVRSTGVHVVGVEGGEEVIEVSQIKVTGKVIQKTRTVRMLERLLRVESTIETNGGDGRADVVVILGTNYSKRISGQE